MDYLLEKYDPNLTIITGDMVSGYAWDYTETFYQILWEKYTRIFLEKKYIYALALGNHDVETNLEPHEIVELDKTNPFSVTIGEDYYLKIDTEDKKDTKAVLWIFNTHNKGCFLDFTSYGCVQGKQFNWLDENMQQFLGQNITHLAFFHIPLPEYNYVTPEYGVKGEIVYCPNVNSGFFELLKKYKFKATFCGHDHRNDFGGFYEGIELIYGRKTGYGSYGTPEDIFKGGRIINISQDGTFEHHISEF